jgi:G3E family GTPase
VARPEVLLFSGFLGSGKTTLIMALARELATHGCKTAFIVNEVGEIGVDQSVMRDGGLEVFEITSGCICCQTGIDLVKTMETLTREHEPEVIIVEASGVATPAGVMESLAYYRGEPLGRVRSIGVLDPTRLEALMTVMTPLIESQISQVQEIVITKVDECSEWELALAWEAAGRLNPDAEVRQLSALDQVALADLGRRLMPGGEGLR